MPDSSLANKYAVVTGASRGIGAAIALELASRGANVLVHYSSSPGPAEAIATQIRAMGRRSRTVCADLSTKECGRVIMSEAAEWSGGKIDILVLCAAVSWVNFVKDLTVQNIDRDYSAQMDINVRSVVLCVNAALPYLARPSRIVLLSSISARGGYETETIYGASKACLEHFARVWSKELGKSHGTTVNCVNPGPVDTEMWRTDAPLYKELGIHPDFEKENFGPIWTAQDLTTSVPVEGRIGQPSDIARIVAFLSSDDSGWVSGSVVSASGGQLVF